MDYRIRPACEDDLPALTQLYLTYAAHLQACGLQYRINVPEVPGVLSARIKSRLFYVGLAQSEGGVQGFVVCSLAKIGREYLYEGSGQTGYIHDVYVAPALRGTGCGQALYGAAEAWLTACGVHALQFEVLAGNTGAKAFAAQMGSCEVGTIYQLKF